MAIVIMNAVMVLIQVIITGRERIIPPQNPILINFYQLLPLFNKIMMPIFSIIKNKKHPILSIVYISLSIYGLVLGVNASEITPRTLHNKIIFPYFRFF